ncbi:MAG TPA: hypothetical protein DHV22_02905, partial [Xanthomarina gelatinilytica]|nr:hypothetical protein [Xanthomarina gelatinilytica]
MNKGFKEFLFEDIVNKNKGFLRGPFGGSLKKEIFVPKDKNTYKVYEQGVVLRKNIEIGDYYIEEDYFNKTMYRFEVCPKDFLVSCSGANYGAIFQMPENIEKGIINQALLRIRLNNKLINDDYFNYFFSHHLVNQIIGKKGDSTIPNFPPVSVLKKLKFKIHSCIIYQKQIAKVLSDLDAKIEVNNKINQELEARAKTLYDYWFVQFDFPAYLSGSLSGAEGYKSSGGKMVFNKDLKREIPEGWKAGTLLDIATYVNGLACQKYRPLDESFLPVIKIREMKGGFTNDTEKVRPNVPDRIKIFDGDILFSWSASLEVIQWAGGNGALNQHIFKVTSNKYPKSYYYFELLNYLQHFKMIADLRKTTMGHITQDHLKQSRIVIPPNLIIQQLDEKLKPILDKQVVLQRENQKL